MTPAIRLATASDAEQVQAIYAPFCTDSSFVSFEEQPPSVDEMCRRVLKTLEQFPWLVCEHRGEILGYAYASRHRERAAYRWSVDVTAYVRDGQRRNGVGRALYTSLFQALRVQGFTNAFAGIALPNPASVGLHEALGFRPVGVYRDVGYKCGAWRDVGWWQLVLKSPPPPPAALTSLTSVCASAEWPAALAAGLPLLRVQ